MSQTQLLLPTAKAVRQHEGVNATVPLLQPRLTPATLHERGLDAMNNAASGATSNAVQTPSSSGSSSTAIWVAAAAVLGALLIGTWVLVTRRRRQEAVPDCESTLAGC